MEEFKYYASVAPLHACHGLALLKASVADRITVIACGPSVEISCFLVRK